MKAGEIRNRGISAEGEIHDAIYFLREIAAQLAERKPKMLKLTVSNGGGPLYVKTNLIFAISKYDGDTLIEYGGQNSGGENSIVKESPEQIIAMMGAEVVEAQKGEAK